MSILFIGGQWWEDIDGIRRYANLAPAETQCEGAQTVLPTPQSHSVSDMISQAAALASQDFAQIVLAASWPGVKAAQISPTKLKAKGGDAVFELAGNLDVVQELQRLFPGVRLTRRHAPPATAPAAVPLPAERAPRIIVTSGPTIEVINAQGDVLTNFSTGAQGAAIADTLVGQGFEVVFVTGPSAYRPASSANLRLVPVQTARQMLEACEAALPAQAFIGVAAVADFAPKQPLPALAPGQRATLALQENPDILHFMGHLPPPRRPRTVIGFAAENDGARLLEYARGKLAAKQADAICANSLPPASRQVTWLEGGMAQEWGDADKNKIAENIAFYLFSRIAKNP